MFLPALISNNSFKDSVANILSEDGLQSLKTVQSIMDACRVKQQNGELEGLIELHNQFQVEIERFKVQLLLDANVSGEKLPFNIGKSILSHSSSILRARYLVSLYDCSTTSDWFKYFFSNWTNVEFSDEVIIELSEIFQNYTMYSIMNTYAEAKNLEEWQKLPDVINVYRGCSQSSTKGFSWSLDLDVAKKFAKRRYGLYNSDPFVTIRMITSVVEDHDKFFFANLKPEPIYILAGQVKKEDALLFLNRKEKEIFSPFVRVLKTYEFTSEEEIQNFKLTTSKVA